MRKKRWFGIVLAVALALSLITVGCAGPEPAVPPPSEEGTPPEEEEEAPPAAPEEEVFHWRASDYMPSAALVYKQAEELCDLIRANTDGRLDIEHYPPEAIVPAYEGMKACEAGAVDMAFCCYPANAGILGRATYLTHNTIAGLNSVEFMMWYYQYGGEEWIKQMLENAGLTSVTAMWMMSGPEDFGYFNKKVTSMDDLKGLKFRTMGVWGKILTEEFGASVITLPGGECYEAMKSGVVDAFEFAMPANDWPLGFQEICEYVEIPGIHTTNVMQNIVINRDRWNELPDDIKTIVMNACKQSTGQSYIVSEWEDSLAIEKFKEYGTEIVVLSEEFQKEVAYAAYAYYDKEAAEDPFFAQGLDSQRYVHNVYQTGGGIRVPVVPPYEEYKASQ